MSGPNGSTTASAPQIERLISGLRSKLVRTVWLHGLGTVVSIAACWILFAFVADRGLGVPAPIRIFHGLVFPLLVAFFLWRGLVRPLRRLPDRAGLAVLLERAHPELREVLVSAVEFRDAGPDPERALGDPGLVAQVIRSADERAAGLDLAGVLEERGPRQRAMLGAISAALLTVLAMLAPTQAGIFAARFLGASTPWPQRTWLTVEVPELGGTARVERTDELIRVRVARGTDVPVVVRAQGEAPDTVSLHLDDRAPLELGRGTGATYRTLLRSMQEDLAFHVTGGDDERGLPRVEIEVLQPPDVAGLAVRVTPPAYSGLQPSLAFDRDLEVLAGSTLRVHVLPYPDDATGVARLLPEDRTLPLERAPFPVDPSDADAGLDEREGLVFDLVAEASFGFRIELTDERGLSNPDPGLYRIRIVEDRAPDVRVLSPARSEIEVVPGGAIAVRARAEDDFGLTSLALRVGAPTRASEPAAEGSEEALPPTTPLALRSLDEPGDVAPGTAPRKAFGGTRLEVDALGGGEPVTVDQRFTIAIEARDTRTPDAGVGSAVPIRVRVVTPEELLRRVQERLARARVTAGRLANLQRERRTRTEELLDALAEGPAEGENELSLRASVGGERRIRGDAEALARDLASAAEDVLYARLDDKSEPMLARLDAALSEVSDLRFHAEPWRELAAARRDGQLGAPGFSATLVDLVDVALEIGNDHAAAAVTELEAALEAPESEARDHLARAIEHQTLALDRAEELLERLAEWDNFQNVLALTRDILNRQKALRERTKQFASEK
jgi:hypothetical protein